MNTYVYIHVCCINNWKQIFDKLISDIKDSGLYEKVSKIRIGILGDVSQGLPEDPKFEILHVSSNMNLYEQSTINLLYRDSLTEDFNVLYLHTKGVKHNNKNPCVTDWVRYMSYFNIYKHDLCLQMLENHDAVGVNLNSTPIHFSGNFWWSTSRHIRGLGPCKYVNYNSPEFWVTSVKGNYTELWNSGVNHYHELYDPSLYLSTVGLSATKGV